MKKKILSGILATIFAITANAQFNKMVIGDNNNGQIVISNIDGTDLDTLTPPSARRSFYDADVDPFNKKIYMAWYYGIFQMNYDGSGFDTIVHYPDGGYSDGVAVDPINGYLYWTSTPENKIYRSDLKGKNITTLFTTTPNGYLADIDIDLVNNKLFFGQYILSDKGVYSIDFNGNNLTQITANGAQYIGLDIKNNRIYFSGDMFNTTCRRVNYDGSNDTLVYTFQGGGFFVDTTNSILYTSDMTNHNIVRSDLNGGSPVNLFANSVLEAPHGPVLLPAIVYSVSVSVDPSAGGTVMGEGNYNEGSSVTLTATANSGYTFVKWTENGSDVSTSNPYTFTINGSRTLVAEFELATGIADIHPTRNKITVYPNPTSKTINFSVPANVQLTNLTGQVVTRGNNVKSLDISGQPSGVYFVTLTDENGQVLQRCKIVKE